MNRRPMKSRSGYDSFSPRHTAHFKASTPDARFFEARQKKPLVRRMLSLLAVCLCVLLTVNFVVNQFVFLRRETVAVKGLCESFDGYTLLHISDLKGAMFGGQDQPLLRLALGSVEFDAVVLTGDMVSSRGNAQPLYTLLEMLSELRPDAPVYFIAGDADPSPASMSYVSGGSPFAPWVQGAKERGAQLLRAPQAIVRDGQTLWLSTGAQLNLDLDTMQGQFEQQYLYALDTGDRSEIELSAYNLQWLEETRAARKAMSENDAMIVLTHVPPQRDELTATSSCSPTGQIDLLLCGHYLGGLIRLPLIGPVCIPSKDLPLYGLFPGRSAYFGLSREGKTWVYSSPGLGAGDPLYPSLFFRLLNPPSVTLITLVPSSL